MAEDMAWGLFPAGFDWHYRTRRNGTPIGTRAIQPGRQFVPKACLDAAVLAGKGEPIDPPDDLGTDKAGATVKRTRKAKPEGEEPQT